MRMANNELYQLEAPGISDQERELGISHLEEYKKSMGWDRDTTGPVLDSTTEAQTNDGGQDDGNE
jgi:hypothetical protein